MAQYLALPLNHCNVTCCYKDEAPNYSWLNTGPVHYGVDLTGNTFSGNRRFFASGTGVVMGTNTNASQTVGRWVAIKYYDVVGYGDLIVRYFHLSTIEVSPGQRVTLDTVIGAYGDTGPYVTNGSYHIHLEVDRDTTYWNYTLTISGTSEQLRAGYRDSRDTTLNPLDIIRKKTSAPERQSCTLSYNSNYRKRTWTVNTF